jgi:hypothetical protein
VKWHVDRSTQLFWTRLLVLFLLLEVGFRLWPLSPERCYQWGVGSTCIGSGRPASVYSTGRGQRFQAGQVLHTRFERNGAEIPVMTNSFGALGEQEPISGKQNVLVVAGQLAMGLGIQHESHFASKLQEHLPNHSVFNASIPQVSGVALIDRARELLVKLEPKTVVFFFQMNSWRAEPGVPIYETSLGIFDSVWSFRWPFEWLLRRYHTIRNYQGSYLADTNRRLLEAHSDISTNWWNKETGASKDNGDESFVDAPRALRPQDVGTILTHIDDWGAGYALMSWEGTGADTGSNTASGRFVFPELRKLSKEAAPFGTEILITVLPNVFQLQSSSNLPQKYFLTFAASEPNIRYFDTLSFFRSRLKSQPQLSPDPLASAHRFIMDGTQMTSPAHETIAQAVKAAFPSI